VALGRVEDDAQSALGDAGPDDELGELVTDAKPRVFQVDRVDRMRGDGHLDARLADDLLLVEADQACPPAARTTVHHAVEVHEADRFTRPIRVRHARPQPTCDEGQV